MSTRPVPPAAEPASWRDRFAVAACNWLLHRVATERYRMMLFGVIQYGWASAARDIAEERPAPLPVRLRRDD